MAEFELSGCKKLLAKYIFENGGWTSKGNFAAQDKWDKAIRFYSGTPTLRDDEYKDMFDGNYICGSEIPMEVLIQDWQQAILSKEEYSSLYGNWIDWNGGECPVQNDTTVEAILRNGCATIPREADEFDWTSDESPNDIVKYRVVKNELREAIQPVADTVATIDELIAQYVSAQKALADAENNLAKKEDEYKSSRSAVEAALKKAGWGVTAVSAPTQHSL